MACRDMEKCAKAKAEIVLETANRNIECKELDLACLDSVKKFADEINQSKQDCQ